MSMVQIHIHNGSSEQLADIVCRLQRLEVYLRAIVAQGEQMQGTVDDILQGVADESTLEDSVLALLKNAATDPAKINQVIEVLTANKAKLNAALTTSTPAAGTPAAQTAGA